MEKLKQWLADNEKSQKWLAEQLGVSQPTVSDWLKGHKTPTVENLLKLREITGISVDDLLGQPSVAA